MRNKCLVIGAMLSSLAVAGCGDNAPKCSDPSTIRTLKEILLKNNFLNANPIVGIKGTKARQDNLAYTKNVDNYTISNITTNSKLDNKRGYSCSAQAELTATKETSAAAVAYIESLLANLKPNQDPNSDVERFRRMAQELLANQDKWYVIYEENSNHPNYVPVWSSRSVKYTVQLTDDGKRLVSATVR